MHYSSIYIKFKNKIVFGDSYLNGKALKKGKKVKDHNSQEYFPLEEKGCDQAGTHRDLSSGSVLSIFVVVWFIITY